MKQRIVVTNDDGVSSPGIHVLAQELEQAGYAVTVIAPDHDASGTGTSLGSYSASRPIRFKRTAIDSLKAEVFAVAGPPALCSLLASYEAFCPMPDVVVSGINAGMNAGRSVVHSGTVGAALAAQNFGMRGLAVSVGSGKKWHWKTAANVAVQVIPAILRGPDRSATNLNVPGIPLDQLKGIRWSHLAEFGSVKATVKRVTDTDIHLENRRNDFVPDWNTDLATTQAGMAAITSLQGPSEVWNSAVDAGSAFDDDNRVHGALAGDNVFPPLVYRR